LRDKLSPKKLAEVATFFLRPKGFQEAYLFVMLLAKQANLKYKLKYPTRATKENFEIKQIKKPFALALLINWVIGPNHEGPLSHPQKRIKASKLWTPNTIISKVTRT